jgi:NADPH-dependent 2,4-dienoyl-CoA reductase/sulfur reductase-like enzyme
MPGSEHEVLAAAGRSRSNPNRIRNYRVPKWQTPPEARALGHLTRAEQEALRVPGVPGGTPVATIRRAAVIGAGTMGGGIAMAYANAGIPVLLKDIDVVADRPAGRAGPGAGLSPAIRRLLAAGPPALPACCRRPRVPRFPQ